MNLEQYFNRIGFYDIPNVTKETLDKLHEYHILHIPFEDLNIHYNIPIEIGVSALFEKIILHHRGGFCYELNSLFNTLLQEIGFATTIISASVINEEGQPGPPFDHMCIIISLEDEDKRWLADVGFGDLFIKPIEIQTNTIQFDSRHYFKIELFHQDQFLLLMSSDGENFEKKYIFSLEEQSVDKFLPQCYDKQHNPNSHFVKNKICTKATPDGRITVFNDKLITTKNGKKSEIFIADEEQLLHILKTEFNMEINH